MVYNWRDTEDELEREAWRINFQTDRYVEGRAYRRSKQDNQGIGCVEMKVACPRKRTKSSWIRGTVCSPGGRGYWRRQGTVLLDICAEEDGLLTVKGELTMGKDCMRQFDLLDQTRASWKNWWIEKKTGIARVQLDIDCHCQAWKKTKAVKWKNPVLKDLPHYSLPFSVFLSLPDLKKPLAMR